MDPDGFCTYISTGVGVYNRTTRLYVARFPLASCRFAELVVKQIERSATQGEEDMKTPWLSCQHHHHSTPD
jgi:hypothetical protein